MADQPARPPAEGRIPAFHGAAHGAGAGGSILLPDMPFPERQPGSGAAQPSLTAGQPDHQR